MESVVESKVELTSLSWTPCFKGELYDVVVRLETTCSSAKTFGMEDKYAASQLSGSLAIERRQVHY